MATVKADSHFVDCDGSTGDGGEWSNDGSEGYPTYEITYFSENAKIWGIPIDYNNFSALALDVDDAVNVGGGVVGLPCAGHPFDVGDVIWIEGTSNYEDQHTLTSGTTANELQFTDTYGAETFDGTETVVQYIAISTSAGRMAQDSDGTLYFGRDIDLTYTTGIVKISADGTIDDDFFSPTGGWPASGAIYGVKVSSDNLYLYVYGNMKKLYKFNLSDGSEVWQVTTHANYYGYNIDIDSNDNVYVAESGILDILNCAKFTAADGSKTELTDMGPGGATYDVCVDNGMSYTSGKTGVVIVGGFDYQNTTPDGLYNLAIRDLDNTDGTQIALGGTYEYAPGWYRTYVIGADRIATYNNYIYVFCNGVVYKLDSGLNTIATIAAGDMPDYPCYLFVDLEGHIVVVNQKYGDGQNDIFWFYDTDLNYLNKTDGLYDVMFWGWSAIGSGISSGNVEFWPGLTAPLTPPVDYSAQSRTVAYPEGYGHLEGETVQVLGDGIYLGTETVVNGEIALDDNTTNNHVGLQFTSLLQPMKIDGEAQVKKIVHLIPDIYESVGGDYGEKSTDLYSMSLRDDNDPMDIDGDLHTGYIDLPFKGSYNRQGDIWFKMDIPLPLNLIGVGVKMAVVESK